MSDRAHENRIRLLLLAEPGLFRTSLARLLAADPDFEVMGECGNCAEALDSLKSTAAHVVLLDFEIGGRVQ